MGVQNPILHELEYKRKTFYLFIFILYWLSTKPLQISQ